MIVSFIYITTKVSRILKGFLLAYPTNICAFFSLSHFQGRDRSARWSTCGAEKTTERVPVSSVVETSVPRAENAVLLQTRECK